MPPQCHKLGLFCVIFALPNSSLIILICWLSKKLVATSSFSTFFLVPTLYLFLLFRAYLFRWGKKIKIINCIQNGPMGLNRVSCFYFHETSQSKKMYVAKILAALKHGQQNDVVVSWFDKPAWTTHTSPDALVDRRVPFWRKPQPSDHQKRTY